MSNSLYKTRTPDYAFIIIVVMLVIAGLVMLTSASSDLAKAKFGDGYYYLKHQIIFGLSFGIVGFIICFFAPIKYIEKSSVFLLGLTILSLLLVFTPLGGEIKGSERWLFLGSFSFQPGEFAKLSLVIFLASWLSRNQARSKTIQKGLLPLLLFLGIVLGLLVLQPSTTIAVIIFLATLIMYFTAGAKMRFIVFILLIVALAFAGLILSTDYRMDRVLGFLDKESDPRDTTYHINQALTAIGSGGITGVGFGNSATKLKYLPEPIGDSIFAVIAEEFGFIGSVVVLFLFSALVGRGFSIAQKTPDGFSRLVCVGFTSIVGIQAFVNIGAISGFLPLTGVPLPFISYGGTALAVFLTMSGIIANISKHRR